MTGSHTTQASVTRVRSRDDTEIGVWASGQGPPLVLVHGSLGDHTRWDALRPHLEPRFTVHALDRRGRGASGDHPDYALEREYEDVAAVIDAVADASGGPADVYCSSFGGLCAFGAAALTWNIRKLALYEAWPPVEPEAFEPPEGFVERVEALLAAGKQEEALETAYRELVGLSEQEITALKAQPSWPARIEAAHTIPREQRAFLGTPFDPDAAAAVTVPTLLLVGSETRPWKAQVETVAAALPNAHIEVLQGQGHVADLFAPEMIAERLLEFLREPS